MEPANKTKTITLPSVVTKYYNHLSIRAQQKQGSKAIKAKKAAKDSQAGPAKRKRGVLLGNIFLVEGLKIILIL